MDGSVDAWGWLALGWFLGFLTCMAVACVGVWFTDRGKR